jgi:hypothetical protein
MLFILYCLVFSPFVNADEQGVASMDKIKAAYLIHLSEFTTWSDEKMRLSHFSICISADSELKLPLEEIEGRLVKNKPLKIQLISSREQLNSCHILYVENGSKKLFEQNLLKPDALLTVGSDTNFLDEGGIIQYYYSDKDDKIKMRVNLKAIAKSKLVMSSKLLRLMDSSF